MLKLKLFFSLTLLNYVLTRNNNMFVVPKN